jgi:hypothetical protein
MIIKFQEKDKWVIFGEVDHIEFYPVPRSEETIASSVLCYDSPNDGEIHGLYDVKFFYKNNGATRIQAYSPIYIMNDQGRTVETI